MNNSAIKDNHKNGAVGEFLKNAITAGSEVSIVSAYFTIFAYHKLKDNFGGINKLKFLFGEPTFIKSLDPEKVNGLGLGDNSKNIELNLIVDSDRDRHEIKNWFDSICEIARIHNNAKSYSRGFGR